MILEVCRRSCAFGANFVRTQQNAVKTGMRGTSELSRHETKATKNGSEDVCEAAQCSTGAWMAHRESLRAFSGGPGKLLDISWPLLARPGRPKIGFEAAFGRSKTVPSASGRVPETVLGAQNGSTPILRRFWIGLGWIFVEIRTIFRRFALEPRATKTRKQDLKKEPRDPQRTSWLLRCGRASYCSHIFPNFFPTLHDQFFSSRTHKPT